VGEEVYLKLQPYVQTSVASRAHHKLTFRYFGPFTITSKIGEVAYKLDLPDNSLIHSVFHVSQLKKAVSPSVQVSTDLPHPSMDKFRTPVPILQRRPNQCGGELLSEVLIQWSSWLSSIATWEDETEIKKLFLRCTGLGASWF
jgi:hypothetical protein